MIKYESMYILKPDMEEEKKDALVKRFSDIVEKSGGKVEKIDEWGKKRLAYPIQYINDGYYVLMTFEADPTLPAELERNYKIADDVLRYIVINLEDQKA
ncbi:30S ribosomal protein S6 [Christensenella tenuis]|jgi:small subunit ribosomal protein S6|uniref:Small ribosomal subunit protein bS6 n=1 Tax=Christensenella tenuis TaxID=2763033 RepID=A0ABR7EF66_9FIRM|nr:30S ribosomal protein S6 [Christensenella tenuis]MBC5647764.1 30S ribosomal protein S6 [Christensenella tenuis]